MESTPGLFHTGADFVSKMELPGILWTHFSGIYFCGTLCRARFHRRLETPPTIVFEGGMECLFCEIVIFQHNPGKRWNNLKRGFFPNLGSNPANDIHYHQTAAPVSQRVVLGHLGAKHSVGLFYTPSI